MDSALFEKTGNERGIRIVDIAVHDLGPDGYDRCCFHEWFP
jgi:hypothetical protein